MRLISAMTRWDFFIWLWAPGLVLAAVAAMTVAIRKERRLFGALGAVATVVAVFVMVSSWNADPAGLEDLGLAATWLLIGVPLTVISAVGASWPDRPARTR